MRRSNNRKFVIVLFAAVFCLCSGSLSFAFSGNLNSIIQEIKDNYSGGGGASVHLQSGSNFSYSRSQAFSTQFTSVSQSLSRFDSDTLSEILQSRQTAVQVSFTTSHFNSGAFSAITSPIGGVSTRQMNQIFGASVIQNLPADVYQDLHSVVADIGVANTQQAVNDIAAVFGNDFISNCDPIWLPNLIYNVSSLGAGGLSDGIETVANAMGMEYQDVVKDIEESGNAPKFINALTGLGVGCVESALDHMASLMAEEFFLAWSNDPAALLDNARFIENTGIDSIQNSLSVLQDTFSASPEYMSGFMCNLILENKLQEFFEIVGRMPESDLRVQLNSMVSVFGLEAVMNEMWGNPTVVVDIASRLDWLDCDDMADLFARVGTALGVSQSDVTYSFQPYEFAFESSEIHALLSAIIEIGIDNVCNYLSEMSDFYTGQAFWDQFQSHGMETMRLALRAVHNMGGLGGIIKSLCQTYSYSDVVYAMQDMGFAVFARFDADDLPDVISNRINDADDGRPLAVVIYPFSDWNGAFNASRTVFQNLIEHGYRVMYYEAETDTELVVCLQNATHNGELPATVLVIGGHGTQQILTLSDSASEEGLIDFSDFDQLRCLDNMLVDGGTIILCSCSNGSGLNEQANMANMWGQLFPNAAHVFAETAPSNIDFLTFDDTGNVSDVSYGCETYDAALYDTDFTFKGMSEKELVAKVAALFRELK